MKRSVRRRNPAVYLIAFGIAATAAPATETDLETGLLKAGAWQEVRTHCGGCHSLSLVTSQQGDHALWRDTIRRMRETHHMHSLAAETETRMLEYLAEHYAPATRSHRRAPLPRALMPGPNAVLPATSRVTPHAATESLVIGRCGPANPPPRQ